MKRFIKKDQTKADTPTVVGVGKTFESIKPGINIVYENNPLMKGIANWFVDLCQFCYNCNINQSVVITNKLLHETVQEFNKKLTTIESDHFFDIDETTHSSIKDLIWYMFECVACQEKLTHCPSYGVFKPLEMDILWSMLHIIKNKYSFAFLQNKWDNSQLIEKWTDFSYFVIGIIAKQDYEMNLINLMTSNTSSIENKEEMDNIDINKGNDLIDLFLSKRSISLLCDNSVNLFQNLFHVKMLTDKIMMSEMDVDTDPMKI